ncbi:SAM-dependent methyltransferase [Mycolicibacterium palauense]|uniref:SAM-dependent methyltransferase n=1 Tax=Mycolicibacterium palauense TaxID=2034511 RepID=UPI000BFECB63|nr:SAM-dependent methyltransferase [Mycolicibacterium palauense]
MRSDNDTWDITTSVGSTALFVAAARALEADKPDSLAVDPFASVFCHAVGGRWAAVLDGEAPGDKLHTEFGTHFVNYQGARTRYFDDMFARATADGVRQIVILAAGLDSRAYRLPWPDDTVIFELDQPQVLDFKRRVLEGRGSRPGAERREVAVDLRDDWTGALRADGFDATRPAAFLAEGLMIYLPAAAQGDLFRGIDDLAAAGSHVGIEEGEPMPEPAYEAAKAAELAADDGEFFTLIYNERYARAADWFGERGWTAMPTPLATYLRTLARPLPDATSEAYPMVQSNTLVRAVKG